MNLHELKQGSPEWHAYRKQHFNASDAPAMMGVSSYKTRTQLLDERATGITPEVDAATQRLFDKGHESEALARQLAEKMLGEDLYPVTGSEGKYSASFDGLNLLGTIAFEHKLLNVRIEEALSKPGATANDLPLEYQVQMEHQCMVSGCEKVLFMASKWDADHRPEELHAWYTPNPELRQKIINGWKQFEVDLAEHKPTAEAPKAQGTAPDSLPALRIELVGQVANTNLPAFKEVALAVLAEIKTELESDQDFADAEKTVKWCADVEGRLAAAKQHALSQTASIEELFRTVDEISEMTRQKRLTLEKLVKTQKNAIRLGIVTEASRQWDAFVSKIHKDLGVNVELSAPGFDAVIKGKRTIASIQDAVDTELANAKAAANEKAVKVLNNLNAFDQATAGHAALFVDKSELVQQPTETMLALIEQRISRAKAEQAERQRIEEERKAQQAERQRIEEKRKAELQEELERLKAQKEKAKSAESSSQDEPEKTLATSKAETSTKTRPTDVEIVDALCLHFRVHQSKVVEWLCEMDLSDASLLEEL